MSVVNKLLRDLDARNAPADQAGIPSAVTPLHVMVAARQAKLKKLFAGVGVGIVIAGAAAWYVASVRAKKAAEEEESASPPSQPIAAQVAKPAPPKPPDPVVSAPASVAPASETAASAAPIATPTANSVPTAAALPAAMSGAVPNGKTPAAVKSEKVPTGEIGRTELFVQIGAFAVKANAEGLLQRLTGELAAPFNQKLVIRPSGKLFLLQVGPLTNADIAFDVRNALRDKHKVAAEIVAIRGRDGERETQVDVTEPSVAAARSSRQSTASAGSGTRSGSTVVPALTKGTTGAGTPSGAVVSPIQTPAPVESALAPEQPGMPAAVSATPPAVHQSAAATAQSATQTAAAKAGRSVPPSGADAVIDKTSRTPNSHERADAAWRRGQLLMRQGQPDDAAALFRAALEDQPEHAAARQTLAGILIDTKRYDEAEDVLRKGVDIPSVRLPSVLALARLKVERNQAPAALDLLQKNAAAGARSGDYQGFMGALLNRLGRHKEAIEHYQTATSLAPSEGRWWAALGIALDAQGQTAEAREAYQKARNLPGLAPELSQHIEQRLK